jgi:hypothetical protein
MNIVTLKVSGSLDAGLDFALTRGDRTIRTEVQIDPSFDAESDPWPLDPFIPLALRNELKQWTLDDPSSGLLVIDAAASSLDAIPWEYLPQTLKLPKALVVRLAGEPLARPQRATPGLLAAGWSGAPRLNLPGIQEELAALSRLGTATAVPVRVLSEPTLDELAAACAEMRPSLLHLVAPGLNRAAARPELALSGGEDLQWVSIDDFLAALPRDFHPRMVVVNTCHAAEGGAVPSITRVVTERLGCVSVGWMGTIDDLAAVDFALFFYARLLEGSAIADALRSYPSLQASRATLQPSTRDLAPPRRRKYPPIPAAWTRSPSLLLESLMEQREEQPEVARPQARGTRRSALAFSPAAAEPQEEPATSATVAVEFEPQKWLNPALLKNGQPAITRLVLNPDRPLRSAGLAIACDTGNGTSTVRQTLSLERGPQPIPTDILQFPALYELIQAGVPRRQINFTVTCSVGGDVLTELTRPVLWMGLGEWLDKPDTWHYIPAFVNPYADGVLDVVDAADRLLKRIVSPTSAFAGYQTGDGAFVVKQVEALYNCLRDDPFHLSYIAPPPIPVYTPGDRLASGQRVRTPTEVVERHRGTCHDLSILFASCMEQIGLYPLVILIPGHTFVGFWKDDQAYEEFWKRARADRLRLPQSPGREWTIVDLQEIQALDQQDAVCFVEATRVTDRNALFAEALQVGQQNLYASRVQFDVAVDIQASRPYIQPL